MAKLYSSSISDKIKIRKTWNILFCESQFSNSKICEIYYKKEIKKIC